MYVCFVLVDDVSPLKRLTKQCCMYDAPQICLRSKIK